MVNKNNIKRHLQHQSTTINLKTLADLQLLRKSLHEEKGICLLAEGTQRCGHTALNS